MFNFFLDIGTHNQREIAHTELNGPTIIDTCAVSDGLLPFETGICCPRYNGGNWVIVENYATKEQAQKGHNKWVGIMSSDEQPESLRDCNNALIASLGSELWGEDWEDDFPSEF